MIELLQQPMVEGSSPASYKKIFEQRSSAVPTLAAWNLMSPAPEVRVTDQATLTKLPYRSEFGTSPEGRMCPKVGFLEPGANTTQKKSKSFVIPSRFRISLFSQ